MKNLDQKRSGMNCGGACRMSPLLRKAFWYMPINAKAGREGSQPA